MLRNVLKIGADLREDRLHEIGQVLADDRVGLGVVHDREVLGLDPLVRCGHVHEPHVVGGLDVERVELAGLLEDDLGLVVLAGAGVEDAQTVVRSRQPRGALQRGLVELLGLGVLPQDGELLRNVEVGLGVVVADVQLVHLLQRRVGVGVAELQHLGRGQDAEGLGVLRLTGQAAADGLLGVLGAVLQDQVAGVDNVGLDRLRVHLPQRLDATVRLVEVELGDEDVPEQRQRPRVLRVEVDRGLQLGQRLPGVVVAEEILRRRDVGRPVVGVHQRGLHERVEDLPRQRVVPLVLQVQRRPTVGRAAEPGDVLGVLELRQLHAAGPLAPEVLRLLDEPRVGGLGGVGVADLLAHLAEQVVPAPGIRVGLEVVLDRAERLIRAADVGQHLDLEHLHLRVIGERDLPVLQLDLVVRGERLERLVRPPEGRQRLAAGEGERDELLRLGVRDLAERDQRGLVPAGVRLGFGLVEVLEIGGVLQVRQVLGEQRVDPLLRDRVMGDVLRRGARLAQAGGERDGAHAEDHRRHHHRATRRRSDRPLPDTVQQGSQRHGRHLIARPRRGGRGGHDHDGSAPRVPLQIGTRRQSRSCGRAAIIRVVRGFAQARGEQYPGQV